MIIGSFVVYKIHSCILISKCCIALTLSGPEVDRITSRAYLHYVSCLHKIMGTRSCTISLLLMMLSTSYKRWKQNNSTMKLSCFNQVALLQLEKF